MTDPDDFLRRAQEAELEGQLELDLSGLGNPPGRYPGDFLEEETMKTELTAAVEQAITVAQTADKWASAADLAQAAVQAMAIYVYEQLAS